MNMLKFFKTAQKVLEKENKQDEAFNFEQMVDWLQSGVKGCILTEEDVIKALEYNMKYNEDKILKKLVTI